MQAVVIPVPNATTTQLSYRLTILLTTWYKEMGHENYKNTPTVNFGSGFRNGDGPAHLPPHTTVDMALGKYFGERWSVSLNAVNLANNRFMLDDSNTFGGTHFVNPRQIYGELRYRFHF